MKFVILQQISDNMGKIVDRKITKIVTLDGMEIIKRITTVLMPNGKYRYPVDYYKVNTGAVEMSSAQLDKVRIPVYKQLI